MGRRKGYKHTEEEKEKLRIARNKYLEKVGTLLGISERENPKEYQRAYQKRYRELHPDYYRSRYKKKEEIIGADMLKLQEIQSAWNLFVSKSIEFEYHTSAYNEEELKNLADDVTSKIANYLIEMKIENEEKDANK